MPNTLLLRFQAPMQSWGISSRFSIRDTGREPSKSGVIGLLCAASGISRDEANINNSLFDAMTKLKMGVCVLAEGIMQKDYHTAQNVAKADGGIKETELSTRWYLADADFLVGLEAEDLELLENLHEAIRKPKWPLFLGRKSFVPGLPVFLPDGVSAGLSIAEAFGHFTRAETKNDLGPHRIVVEDSDAADFRQDVPLDFAARRFTVRYVKTDFITLGKGEKGNGSISDEDNS
jgi:CRISPR system Cascade subunit CasD